MSEEGLNQNPTLRTFMLVLIDAGATAFVETGTLWGDTCLWITKRRPNIPIYTCEINSKAIAVSRDKFVGYDQIHSYSMSSEKFIPFIAGKLGNLPIFYLDAHWGVYWPILDELRAIGVHHHYAYIVIHDFQVPGIPGYQGQFDKLNAEYIRPALSPNHTYSVFYPSRYIPGKSGFAVLFQNAVPVIDPDEFTQGGL